MEKYQVEEGQPVLMKGLAKSTSVRVRNKTAKQSEEDVNAKPGGKDAADIGR
jgi:hypothetical protein